MEITSLLDNLEKKISSLVEDTDYARLENEELKSENDKLKATIAHITEQFNSTVNAHKAEIARLNEQMRSETDALKLELEAERQASGAIADRIDALLGRIDNREAGAE